MGALWLIPLRLLISEINDLILRCEGATTDAKRNCSILRAEWEFMRPITHTSSLSPIGVRSGGIGRSRDHHVSSTLQLFLCLEAVATSLTQSTSCLPTCLLLFLFRFPNEEAHQLSQARSITVTQNGHAAQYGHELDRT